MRRRLLDPVGVELSGFTLAGLGPSAVPEFSDLLAQHGVLVMPDQRLDDVEFARFLRLFGELMFTTGESPVDGHPDLNVISNVGRTTPPRSTFHVDTSYIRNPPAYTALRAVEIPSRGGETLFSDQYRAYDTLPADVRALIEWRTIRHVVTGLDLGPDDETEAEHPIVRRHPVSGRRSLYLTTPARCHEVSGMGAAESEELVRHLFEHSTRDDNVLRHAWSPGDVVMWDNGCVLHRADHARRRRRPGHAPRHGGGVGRRTVTAPTRPVAVTQARTVATLTLLFCALPLNVAVTAVAAVRSAVVRTPLRTAADPRTVLISGGKMTKALQLARSFHAAGHRVVLVETAKYRFTGHRFSRAVDRFRIVPPPDDPGYAQALLEIVRSEGVDVYVPVCSPKASRYDALAKELLAPHCEVIHGDADLVEALDDKDRFSAMARTLGLAVPDSVRVTAPEQVEQFDFAGHRNPYILKSIPYDPVHRLDLTPLPRPDASDTAAFATSKPMSPDVPWILQEFVTGQEYCTHSTVRDGVVQLHACCESSAFQINYEMVDKPEITEWVTRFVGAHKITGQVSFDFIQAVDGQVYAIECNPRTHSAITMFYDNPDVAAAYLDDGVPVVRPTRASRPTYWIYHELWRLATNPSRARLRTILRGKDAIFDWSDPLPFLMVHHVQIPWLLLQNLRQGKDWLKIDFNIGKLVEAAGD